MSGLRVKVFLLYLGGIKLSYFITLVWLGLMFGNFIFIFVP
jgi:hypothetical protein